MKPRARLHSLSCPPLTDHFEIDLRNQPGGTAKEPRGLLVYLTNYP